MNEAHGRGAPRVAIVGMAGRFPGAPDVEAFWRDISAGISRITRFTEAELRASGVPDELLRDPAYVPVKGVLSDADCFDAALFGMSAREAELTDPQHRVFLECGLAALEDAGYARPGSGQLVGVFAGCGASEYAASGAAHSSAARTASEYQRAIACAKDFLATRLSYKLDLRGPSLTVQTACSTALVAVILACQSLLTYQCDVALAGGVAISLPLRAGYLHQPGMVLSPSGICRPFDADASGTVPGDGVGAVVLRRLEDALADGDTVLAVLCGFGINNDGAAKQSFSAPSVEGQAVAVAQALAMAAFSPETVSYVEAHGTGTPMGDPIEVAALARAFGGGSRRDPCVLGSVKANIGHLDAAAGIAGLIKVVQMLRYREIPPSLNVQRVSPRIDLSSTPFSINLTRKPWDAAGPRRAGVSSFGLGGTNAHVVLEEAPLAKASEASARPPLFTLSAATEEALDAVQAELAQHLAERPDVPLADVAFTLHSGRRAYRHRRAIACSGADRAEALAALADRSAGEQTADSGQPTPEVVFLFPGHGSGYPAMGRALYDAWPSYRADIDEGIALLRSRMDIDLRVALFPEPGDSGVAAAAIDHAAIGQPATFLVEWAVGRLLLSWGVRPCALLGHSLGEYAAACLAGVMSLEDGLCLVAKRGALVAGTPEGAMLAVEVSPAALAPLLGSELSVAAINGPSRGVVAGSRAAVAALERALAGQSIANKRLRGRHAFHSRLMEGIIEPFTEAARRIPLRAPQIPLVSCLTADILEADEVTDPSYWGRHLREPVRFDAALRRSCEAPSRILVEVGPGETLTKLAWRHPGIAFLEALTTMHRPGDRRPSEAQSLMETVGRLWMRDVAVDLPALDAGERRQRVRLPAYPFERQRYWRAFGASAPPSPSPPAAPGLRDVGGWFYQMTWRRSPRTEPLTVPPGEYLIFADGAGLAAEMKHALPDERVTLVYPGDQFKCIDRSSYTIRPGEPDDYAALLRALDIAGKPPDHALYLWGLDAADVPLEAELDRGLLRVIRLLRALGKARVARPLKLLIVTRGAQPAAAAPVERPAQAMASVLPRVVPEEYPHILCGTVDLAGSDLAEHALSHLACELIHELALIDEQRIPTAIALRARDRYELTFEQERVDAAPQRGGGLPLRPRGACLITGGLGGIGLVLARHLASAPSAQLVLLSRTGLPPRSFWPSILAEDQASDPGSLASRVRAVLDLERTGAEVLVLAADVASEPEMRRAIAEARLRFGSIGAVIHAAGVPCGGVIQRQSEEEVREALSPKLQGTVLLAALTRDEPLELFAMCSSLTAIGGGFGQLAYGAANCFLDAFASCLRARGVRAVSINWDGWTEVGMAARAARTTAIETEARREKTHPLLGNRVLGAESLALYQKRIEPTRDWILGEHWVCGRPTLPGAAFIELSWAAAAVELGDRPMVLRDIILSATLEADDGEVMEVWTSARRSAGRLTVQICGRAAGTESTVQTHMRCTADLLDRREPAPIALDSLRDGCPSERSPEELLARWRDVIDIGPRFRCMRRLWLGPQRAVAELIVPDDPAHPLHPAVLDMIAGCAEHLASDDLMPPVYDVIRIYGPIWGRAWILVRMIEERAFGARFSAVLYDERGAPRVEIDGHFPISPSSPRALEEYE